MSRPAIAGYLECRPPCRSDRIFLRTIAPCRPFRNGDGISCVVKRIMKRAGIVTPVKGAHVLRHTAASQLLAVPVRSEPPASPETTAPDQPRMLPRPCTCCGGRMVIIETFGRGCEPRHRPTPTPTAIRIDTS
jgi:hypothetical protein